MYIQNIQNIKYLDVVDDDISPSAGSKPNPKFGLETRVPFPPYIWTAVYLGPFLSPSNLSTVNTSLVPEYNYTLQFGIILSAFRRL